MTKFKGIPLNLGGQDFVVPPLNFRKLQELQAQLQGFEGGVDPKSIDTVVDVLHGAITRNYPEVTREQCIDFLDLENMLDVFQACMDVSGMKRKQLEAATAASDSPSTGPTPTPNL